MSGAAAVRDEFGGHAENRVVKVFDGALYELEGSRFNGDQIGKLIINLDDQAERVRRTVELIAADLEKIVELNDRIRELRAQREQVGAIDTLPASDAELFFKIVDRELTEQLEDRAELELRVANSNKRLAELQAFI